MAGGGGDSLGRVLSPSPHDELTVLTVHAHPDDESISMGGTLARAAAEGHKVVVVTGAGSGFGRLVCEKAAALGLEPIARLDDSAFAGREPEVHQVVVVEPFHVVSPFENHDE